MYHYKNGGDLLTVEVAFLISFVSVIFGIYTSITSIKRSERLENKTDASQLTTVIVKLEAISTGVTEIKTEMSHIKTDVRDTRERLIKVEESVKHAHKRLTRCEKNAKILFGDEEECEDDEK